MRMNSILTRWMVLAFLAAALGSPDILAAEIELGNVASKNSDSGESNKSSIWLEGEIIQGDYDRFVDIYQSGRIEGRQGVFYPNNLRLSSPGGDLSEAIRIAEFVEQLKIPVTMAGPCNSACFFILVGSAKRNYAVSVGLHRPFFERQYFAQLDATEAQLQYSSLINSAEIWLKQRFVSSFLVDKMTRTPSFEAFVLSPVDIEKELGAVAPVYEEWIAAKCGFLTGSEKLDREVLSWADMYGDFTQEELGEIEPIELWSEVFINLNKAKSLSSGYRDYLMKKDADIYKCEFDTVSAHRRAILD